MGEAQIIMCVASHSEPIIFTRFHRPELTTKLMKVLPLFAVLCWCLSLSSTAAAVEAEADPSPGTFVLNEFTFARPKAWLWERIKTPKQPTVVLQSVDKKARETARIVMIHYLPTEGLGKRGAALKRWKSAFLITSECSTNSVTIANHPLTYAEVSGTHKGEKPGVNAPLPDFALFGAIIEGPKGNVVIKMTGPKAIVEKSKAAFRKMVESALKTKTTEPADAGTRRTLTARPET
jgi:hypothetical protein